ncbi:patatin-like protein [Hypericibacter sp.]|uniref:patatin-like protein n=1 Tax=Hypericibacter sp. TaxID=2705401 RepID=UPI003D6DA2D3
MKEKELRLALVCYGGISLAVYMHGITKEVLKLARASRLFHSNPDRSQREQARFDELKGKIPDEVDSEAVYFDLLKAIGEKLDLRVVVDSIAGASAGGINGIILARALAHDLSIDHMRSAWIDEADVVKLTAPDRLAKPWSKFVLHPILWVAYRMPQFAFGKDREIRTKLSIFLRSRWFKPPFDGQHFLGLLFDAMKTMRKPELVGARSSLLPVGHALDLSVTLTDFFGYSRPIAINSPPVIQEREHSHLLRFHYTRWDDGTEISDFGEDNLPALAFAARATSSFPGAFPPTQLKDLDAFVKERGEDWPMRAQFLATNFFDYANVDQAPFRTSFLDGSVVDNKPFAPVVESIRNKPAYRNVDRRIVYIDPDPEPAPPPPGGEKPGFIATLKAALSDIPRNEPVYDDLAWVSRFNQSIKRMRHVLDAARPEIVRLVSIVTKEEPITADFEGTIKRWRDAANGVAAREAHYAYQVYARLKMAELVESLGHQLKLACGIDATSPLSPAVPSFLAHWLEREGARLPDGAIPLAVGREPGEKRPGWIRFLGSYDIDFRRRRLSFLIRGLNRLYGQLDTPSLAGVTSEQLDTLKAQFYKPLHQLRRYSSGDVDELPVAKALRQMVEGADPKSFPIDQVMQRLAEGLNLPAVDAYIDGVLAEVVRSNWSAALHRELIVHYVGFAFWDVLTFPIAEWRDIEEHEEVRVDRISPEDALSLSGEGAQVLEGIAFGHFGGFFSRPHRENDYLWGRLHGAERLIDIIYDAARSERAAGSIDILAVKRAAFRAILATERKYLGSMVGEIDALASKAEQLKR